MHAYITKDHAQVFVLKLCHTSSFLNSSRVNSSCIVNRKFFDNTYTVFGEVDHWIATIGFMSNLIILTKKDESHCRAEIGYIWPERLADDCPAKTQSDRTIAASPVKKYCESLAEHTTSEK